MSEKIEKCFFCDKIIIPNNIFLTEDIVSFFKKIGEPFNLNYTKLRFRIGNKNICSICEIDFKNFIFRDFFNSCECCENNGNQEENYK